MSDEPNPPLTGDVHPLVTQKHGGAIRNTPPARIPNPTATDVAINATRYLYRELPRLRRIAHNEAKRPKTKAGKAKKRARGRAIYTIEQQLSAFRVLAEMAKLDRTVRAAAVDEFIAGIIDDVRSQLPPEQANVLLSMFKDRARRI